MNWEGLRTQLGDLHEPDEFSLVLIRMPNGIMQGARLVRDEYGLYLQPVPLDSCHPPPHTT